MMLIFENVGDCRDSAVHLFQVSQEQSGWETQPRFRRSGPVLKQGRDTQDWCAAEVPWLSWHGGPLLPRGQFDSNTQQKRNVTFFLIAKELLHTSKCWTKY